jgi:RNA polymerase sigma-70 factor (ECF subfamily)
MQYDYEEIADIVGKSNANCRQIFHRAKRSLSVKYDPDQLDSLDREQATNLVEKFMRALASGDASRIIKFLSADAVLITDGGGKVKAQLKPFYGHTQISRLTSNFLKKWSGSLTYRITMVNDMPGIIVYMDGKTRYVISLRILNDHILNLYIVANPDKLTHVI